MSEVKEEQVKEWKEQYGRVLKIKLGGVDYYYRPLNTDEYLNIQKLVESGDEAGPEMLVAIKGTLTPTMDKNAPAGAILTLSDEIMKISGFVPEGEPEEL